jgi:uncharacterized protein with FMN-binding domain
VTHPESSDHRPSKAHAGKSAKRTRRNLIALGSAAVVAAYAAGFARTWEAADRMASEQRPRADVDDAAGIVMARLLESEAPSLPVAATESIPANAPVPPVPAAMPAEAAPVAEVVTRKYKDGFFFGWGYCRHGELKVLIEIKDDRIVSATIDECYTRYSKNVIAILPKRVVDRQSPNVDWVSGATQSSDAFYYAVVEALKAAKP